MKFHLHTYGCQMNERDSESAAAILLSAGYEKASRECEADIVLVNTCSVRGKAEDKAVGKLGMLVATLKKEKPDAIVGAMGCMVQRVEGSLFERVKGLDFAIGTKALPVLADIVGRTLNGEKGLVITDETDHGVVSTHVAGQISAYVNILMGCDRRCSYCIVPTVRGREWSRPASEVVEEVERLAEQGVKEVTLLGQSVMSYGRKNEVWPDDYRSAHGYSEPLPRLLEAVDQINGISRIRFTSGHPMGCTHELSAAVAELEHVCEHMHVPLQSGSDRILNSMGRGYSAAEYKDAINRLRDKTHSLTLTTDIIVGYPGETAEEFEMTRLLMDEMRFDNAFIFKYSPRPGTRAAAMDDDVSADEKARRNAVLLEDQDRRGRAINNEYIGTQQEVLCEGVSLRNSKRQAGRSRGNKIVVFDSVETVESGDTVIVSIDKAGPQTLYGKFAGLK